MSLIILVGTAGVMLVASLAAFVVVEIRHGFRLVPA